MCDTNKNLTKMGVIIKGFTIPELNGRHSNVIISSIDFSFQIYLVFWNLFEFSAAKIT